MFSTHKRRGALVFRSARRLALGAMLSVGSLALVNAEAVGTQPATFVAHGKPVPASAHLATAMSATVLARAHRDWPNAVVVTSGVIDRPGDFVVAANNSAGYVRILAVERTTHDRQLTPTPASSNLSIPGAPVHAAAWSGCRGFWTNWYVFSGTSLAGVQSLNVGFCSNNSSVWKNWGPDCPFHSGAYFGGYDQGGWCGYGNGNPAMAGVNFWVSPYTTPFYKAWGYVRFDVYANGITHYYGSCC
jgi:hypothetical protein